MIEVGRALLLHRGEFLAVDVMIFQVKVDGVLDATGCTYGQLPDVLVLIALDRALREVIAVIGNVHISSGLRG